MSNELTTVQYHASLPAYLRDQALFEATDRAIAGISGGIPPYISIKASKFRLIDGGGAESMVNQMDPLLGNYVDVIVLGGNEHVSKSYYAGAYDAGAGNAVPPTCWSDNGQAPSSRALTPQAASCAACQHNVWGSKITPTGGQTKACADSKKLAVVLAAPTPTFTGGAAGTADAVSQVYLLRVPAASMKTWRDYAADVRGRGVPIVAIVVRLSFDPSASYPSLMFKTIGFVSEATFGVVRGMLSSQAIKTAVGSDDVPLARVAQSATPMQHITVTAPVQAAPQLQTVVPANSMASVGADPFASMPTQAVNQSQVGTPRKQGRPPKAAAPAPSPAPLTPAPAPAAVDPFATLAGQPAASSSVMQTPKVADAGLEALLAAAMAP